MLQVTLQRFWSKMGFIEKLKMFAGLVAAVLGIVELRTLIWKLLPIKT
jgi:pheromone shutdown protein TraB